MAAHRAWPLGVIVALVLAVASIGPGLAAPLAAPPVISGPGAALAQGYCGRQNFVCRRRFGEGKGYRRCMARRGCAIDGGGGASGDIRDRCQARGRFCARRFDPGSPAYSRCMRRGGC